MVQRKILTVTLTAWDILDMEFLSIKESNDYRRSSKKVPVEVLVDLYRDYDNERSAKEGIFQNVDADGVFRTLMGMTAEQFAYEDLYCYLKNSAVIIIFFLRRKILNIGL